MRFEDINLIRQKVISAHFLGFGELEGSILDSSLHSILSSLVGEEYKGAPSWPSRIYCQMFVSYCHGSMLCLLEIAPAQLVPNK